VEVHSPRSLDEALALKAAHPDGRFVQGGTDVLVDLNFDRERPSSLIALDAVAEIRGWRREEGRLVLGAGLTYAEAMSAELASAVPALAEAARTVGSPQIRNRGTIGGNLGTGSPAGDALPPLLVEGAEVTLASVRGVRSLPLTAYLVGPKQTALADDEVILDVRLRPSGARQTFMKVGPRNAMVISVCSLALAVDRERDEVRAAIGSVAPVATLLTTPPGDAETVADAVVAASSPIDDVRGSAAYRRHALRVLTIRALQRCAP
jgi:CO/xanthine dehydrogenase FAD-binding subunit